MPEKLRDPMRVLKEQIQNEIKKNIKRIGQSIESKIPIEESPRKEYGEFSSPVSFTLAKRIGKENIAKAASKIAEDLVEQMKTNKISLISKIEAIRGHINFFLDWEQVTDRVLTTILSQTSEYGKNNLGKGKKIVVEHTSANPVHPIHIGTARNSVIGDAIRNLLEACNYTVQTRYYLDDVGKQVAYLAYTYKKLQEKIKARGKVDHFFGILYSCAIVTIKEKRLNRELKDAKAKYETLLKSTYKKLKKKQETVSPKIEKQYSKFQSLLSSSIKRVNQFPTTDWRENIARVYDRTKAFLNSLQEEQHDSKNSLKAIIKNFMGNTAGKQGLNQILSVKKELEEWKSISNEISMKWPKIHELTNKHLNEENIEEKVREIVRDYEQGGQEYKNIIQEVCQRTFEGFKKTFTEMGITFDKIDWESELVWDKKVEKIINRLKEGGWIIERENNALALNIRDALKKEKEIREIFNLEKKEVEKLIKEKKWRSLPPNLVLLRGDGSSLYATRDIAYTIKKFRQDPPPNRVLNIIGKDQNLTQKQVATGVFLSGYEEYAENLEHISYELVRLPKHSMSARRGRYRTLDEILEEAKVRAHKEVKKRGEVSWEETEKIAHKIAVGAVRYFLLSTDPRKTLTFKWEEIMNFNRNSGPFVQYSFARATSILEKVEETIKKTDFKALEHKKERKLVLKLAQFPEKIKNAAKNRLPNIITEYCDNLAESFHSFYEECPVLTASTTEIKKNRVAIVKAYITVLKNALKLIRIEPLERM